MFTRLAISITDTGKKTGWIWRTKNQGQHAEQKLRPRRTLEKLSALVLDKVQIPNGCISSQLLYQTPPTTPPKKTHPTPTPPQLHPLNRQMVAWVAKWVYSQLHRAQLLIYCALWSTDYSVSLTPPVLIIYRQFLSDGSLSCWRLVKYSLTIILRWLKAKCLERKRERERERYADIDVRASQSQPADPNHTLTRRPNNQQQPSKVPMCCCY